MPETTERNYKAFISYRHRPLDMAVAKKLHKRIERYVIPKDLRKDGEKKLGLVFRDQDELPISNNLTENIRIALDHSEFLIVICTPDTPLSEWVKREITYFTEHHSRDRVLAVLADGEPEQSFPKPLTEVYNEAGELIETIEPLAGSSRMVSLGSLSESVSDREKPLSLYIRGCTSISSSMTIMPIR